MDRETAERVMRDALIQLLVEDHDLCTSGANERSVTSQIFRYIAGHPQLPPGVNVDHEYNRVGEHYVKNLRMCFMELVTSGDLEDTVDRNVMPDILVHGRGDHETNLIAVEVKPGAVCDIEDAGKICALTSDPYAYRHGILLALGRERDDAGPRWNPRWIWNPREVGDLDAYQPVFTWDELRELVEIGRHEVEQRKRLRKEL